MSRTTRHQGFAAEQPEDTTSREESRTLRHVRTARMVEAIARFQRLRHLLLPREGLDRRAQMAMRGAIILAPLSLARS